MPGRKRKPTALKVLEGNPGKRPLPANEPKPIPVAPKCPTWLCREGRRLWKYLAPRLERLGLLTEIDGPAFAAVCQSFGTYVELEQRLKQVGRTMEFTNKAGATNEAERPEGRMARQALEQCKTLFTEFGLTPASRARICVKADSGEQDPMETLLRKAGL